jgi:hypothetical protein
MIGRFQVMATLQAARAYALGFSLDETKSFGLNRAIFLCCGKERIQKIKRSPAKISLPREIFKILKKELKKIKKVLPLKKLEMKWHIA